ncbi:UDP-glucose/GDP-mannose dehydrogenase family protein [Ammoniphilus sp. 3BR4]|uniref:UDP-glucose dehydrogenase family protein n=1 Tax=Ammoniphilus sp. 3BR4 TaxID=3158265 RepID=UPI0034674AD7
MNVSVIGAGYVGLVTGVCLSEIGNRVLCYDIDADKIRNLQRGISPIYEPGLKELIEKNKDHLHFTSDLDQAICQSEIIFIAVGTPTLPSGRVDLSPVKNAAAEIAKRLNAYKLIVVKSTVPVGTNDELITLIRQIAPPHVSFDVASNPEFLREGSAIQDVFQADRIVIGARSERAFDGLVSLYEPLQVPILKVDIRSAEMIKYASNAFLATKISFINEIANLCEKVGADIQNVAKGMGYDHRIGPYFLQAGIGYGGSCFPKDTAALVQMAGEADYEFKILRSVIEVNRTQCNLVIEKLLSVLGSIEGKTVSIFGLSFKPNTDDVRESPAIEIIQFLLQYHASIKAFDPIAMTKSMAIFPQIYYATDVYDTLDQSEAALIITDWPQFKEIDWCEAGKRMKNKFIIDGRNMLDPGMLKSLGFIYHSFGRGSGKE